MAADPPPIRLRPGAVTWREVGDEVVLLDGSSATFLQANATASLLWRTIAGGATRSQLIDALVGEFDVDEATAAEAVDAFVDACRRRRLLL
jgi:hypothetical protein